MLAAGRLTRSRLIAASDGSRLIAAAAFGDFRRRLGRD
jgi:hypothetical protein